jgi:hypothetical protein
VTKFRQRPLAAAIVILTIAIGKLVEADASGSVITLSLADAALTPVPVLLAIGQPALVEIAQPVIVVGDSPPGVVHTVVHGSDVLIVPIREGTTVLSIGLADKVTARLSVSVGTADGVRLVTLYGNPTGFQGAQAPAQPPGRPQGGTAAPVRLDPRVTVSVPTGLSVQAVATLAGGVLYVSYVIQNQTTGAIHADPRAVEVSGTREPATVRQMDVSTAGEIAAGSMETGVIACTPATDRVGLTWRLQDRAGSGMSIGIDVALR